MPFNHNIPVNDTLGNADPIRENFNALHDETAAILADVTTGALPKKTGDGTLGDSVITEDASNVIVQTKLLSLRRADSADAVLLEIHNGSAAVFHIRIGADGGRIVFSSNRPGFSFQTPLDVNGAPVAMKPLSVSPLSLTVSDPPTQSDVQTIANKLDEFIGAMNG